MSRGRQSATKVNTARRSKGAVASWVQATRGFCRNGLWREKSADVYGSSFVRHAHSMTFARREKEVESMRVNSVGQGSSPCAGARERLDSKDQHGPVAHLHSSSQTKARLQDQTRGPGLSRVQTRADGAVQTPIQRLKTYE